MTVRERILALKLLKKQDAMPDLGSGYIVQIKMVRKEEYLQHSRTDPAEERRECNERSI